MKTPIYRLVDQRGRIYLPKGVREKLGLDCGDFVKLREERNQIQLEKVHLLELGDKSPEAVEAYVQAAAAAMPREKQMALALRLLEAAKEE